MKITMSFSVGNAHELAEARKFFDRLEWADEPAEPTPATLSSPAGATIPPGAVPPPPGAVPPPPGAVPPPPGATAPQTDLPGVPAPPAAAPPAVELDKSGRPWDARFHAKTKTKTKDDLWRRKRGVKAEEVEAGLPVTAPTVPTVPAGVVPPTPPLAPPPPANGAITWEAVAVALQARALKYTQEQVQAGLRAAGIEPTTLHTTPAQYAVAIGALETHCPL